MEKNRILFWGAGKTAEQYVKLHKKYFDSQKILGFIDSDENKQGGSFFNYPIYAPDCLCLEKFDFIVITSRQQDEIIKTLSASFCIPKKKILSMDEMAELALRALYGGSNGRQFQAYEQLAEFSHSEKNYIEMKKDMEHFFSYLYIKEKYQPYIEHLGKLFSEDARDEPVIKKETPIWLCWLQGFEDAPDIVKCCMNSVKKNIEGDIHYITYQNYADYVNLPEHIIKKHRDGLICHAHFSDMIRLLLLIKYGGIWMDATILMIDQGIPDYIYDLPLFMFRVENVLEEGKKDPRLFANWFIRANKENQFLKATYDILVDYWKNENKCIYLIMHYIMRLLWGNYEDAEKNKLVFYYENSRIMQRVINDVYDENLWELIKNIQPIQKLDRRVDFRQGNTFYSFINERYGK